MAAMALTVEPDTQRTVDDVMTNPSSHEGDRIHLRGVVGNGTHDVSNRTFTLEGLDDELAVFIGTTAVPEGFEEGRTIAIHGTLILSGGEWTLRADEIKTGCPSKYEAAES